MHEDSPLQMLTAQLTERDWALWEGFLDRTRVTALRTEAEGLLAAGHFRAAGIGQEVRRRADIRSDELLWITPDAAPQAASLLQSELEALRQAVNAATYLGLHEFEGHYAAYRAGASYARHLDRFRVDNRRVISMVLYLNDAWTAVDGGELRLYPDGTEAVTVLPRGGTLVCFLSERVPHEVLPARRLRLGLAGWFRRRA
ncbi:MAG TPA: 2OG-Fe(II) oxygenase [Gammaproteobacteria bacterium]|nr:2OG-Fe(II) oxygenase [Gammaproteobacteria bacterium]